MPTPLKFRCQVSRIVAHGDGVYTVTLRPERPVPRFRAGQSLHLALDAYDPTSFWPDSRVFSIASSPSRRDAIEITYAVHGRFSARMERELVEGRELWVKMPYGDFVVDDRAEVALFAGGTGITAFTGFLGSLAGSVGNAVTLAYGARSANLLIYRDLVEACARRSDRLRVRLFSEDHADSGQAAMTCGRVSVEDVLPLVRELRGAQFYISGPPAMLRAIGDELSAHKISREAIHLDAWE